MFRYILLILILLPYYAFALFNASLAPQSLNLEQPGKHMIDVVGEQTSTRDMVALVEGPERQFIIKYKIQKFGMWFNSQPHIIRGMSAFYKVYSTSHFLYDAFPLPEVIKYNLDPTEYFHQLNDKNPQHYIVAEKLAKLGLYSKNVGNVEFVGDNFFRFNIALPKAAQLGQYQVKIYSKLNDEEIQLDKTLTFNAEHSSKSMLLAQYFVQNPTIYGIACIALGILSGVIYGLLFITSSRTSRSKALINYVK